MKTVILNALAFEPTVTSAFAEKFNLLPAPLRGSIFFTDGEITRGCQIVATIKAQQNDTFLVSKVVFDHLNELGYRNVAMFDPSLTEYEGERATAQGGLLFTK